MTEAEKKRKRSLALALAVAKAKAATAAPAQRNPDGTYGAAPDGFVLNPATGQTEDMRSPNNPNISEGTGAALAQGVGQGLSFGGMDEVVGGMYGMTGPGSMAENYDYATAKMREELARGRDQHPIAAYGGEVAGAIAAPFGAAKAGATLWGSMGRGAVAGAGAGGLYGLLSGEGDLADRAGGAVSGGILGGVIGAAAPAVVALGNRAVRGAQNASQARAIARNAPSMADLKAEAGALYAQADKAIVARSAFGPAVQNAITAAERKGMDVDLTPGAAKVADRLSTAADDLNPGLSFRELQTLREKAAIPAGNVMVPREAALGSGFIEAIDDFVDNVDPALSETVGKARELWARLAKSKKIQAAIDKAQNQASGLENGLRVQFRAILDSTKQKRGFTKGEIAAMEAVVRGTPFGNFMRKIGVFGMSAGQGGSGLGIMTGAGAGGTIGTLIGGPAGGAVGAVLPGIIGTGAKALGSMSTQAAAERARAMIAAGMTPNATGLLPAMQSQIGNTASRGLLPFAAQVELPLPVGQRR